MKLRFLIFTLVSVLILVACGADIELYKQANASEPYRINVPLVSNPLTLANVTWAFEERFEYDPAAPSQALLPRNFGYAVTHRTSPANHFNQFPAYMADHAADCMGPDPARSPLPQHSVQTSHMSNSSSADQSFFICKNHMMSSMGEVEGYSVTSFWPRQEFDFSQDGILEFDVNINGNHPRTWFEVLIVPRSELKVGAAPWWLPIDEAYPKDRIVFQYNYTQKRYIQVGTEKIDPEGITAEFSDWQSWAQAYPSDPANSDRRIRRTMRIFIRGGQITWSIEKADGSFDDLTLDLPQGLPFTQGLVVFKTHAYVPQKEGNHNNYTFHWDNIRFSGPVVGRYEAFDANDVVYLQANGDRRIGETKSIMVDLPHIGPNPVLFGQVHSPKQGQVLLSINGSPPISVEPYDYVPGTCSATGWKSFQLNLDEGWLVQGRNTFTWTIGPRPACAESWLWDGFSIKNLEVNFDLGN